MCFRYDGVHYLYLSAFRFKKTTKAKTGTIVISKSPSDQPII